MKYLQASINNIDKHWQDFLLTNLANELNILDQYLQVASESSVIYPQKEQIFRALKYPPQEQKVVIIGQDPYHGVGEANGLAFAVNANIAIPPSLRNIRKELINEYELAEDTEFDKTLESWLSQKVLLLNSSLTVIQDQANSMAKIGWHEITDSIIKHISNESAHCVFMLWGNFARAKAPLIDENKHLILESVHPSPLSASRGFFGCNHFQLANKFLAQNNQKIINWL